MSKPEGLLRLVEEGIIDAVHARLMSGKEATVFVVERAGTLGAAKVYKSRQDRTFKKVASYTEGRNQTRNSRDRRAMDKKTSYGRELMEEGWQDMEFRALRAAFDAGVRVPEPFFLYEDILFMELVVDSEGNPASRLADFPFTPEEATALHLEVFMQVKKLLETGRVHGDLSAYNILMADKGPTIIDMPQVVDVSGNANAGQILRRDLHNVTEHLARFDARLLRFADCGEALFRHFANGTLDQVTGPEVVAPQQHRGGRRQRDAERGRSGRDKAPRPQGPDFGHRGGPAPGGNGSHAGPRDGGARDGRDARDGAARGGGGGDRGPHVSVRPSGPRGGAPTGAPHERDRGPARPESAPRGSGGDRPAHDRDRGPARPDYAPRGAGGDRPAHDRDRGPARPDYAPRGAGGDRPAHERDRGPARPEYAPRGAGGDRPAHERDRGPARPEYAPRGADASRGAGPGTPRGPSQEHAPRGGGPGAPRPHGGGASHGGPTAGGRETREVVRETREVARDTRDANVMRARGPEDGRAGYAPRPADRADERGGPRGPAPVARRDERGLDLRSGLGTRGHGHEDDPGRRRR